MIIQTSISGSHFLRSGQSGPVTSKGTADGILLLMIKLEKAMAPHCSPLAWKIPWMEEPGGLQSMGSRRSRTRPIDFTFPFHFHALEKEMATHSSVLAWRIPETGAWWAAVYGSHRVGHDWRVPYNDKIQFEEMCICHCELESFPVLRRFFCWGTQWY